MKKKIDIEMKGGEKGVHVCPSCEWHNSCPTEMDFKEVWACVQFKKKDAPQDTAETGSTCV